MTRHKQNNLVGGMDLYKADFEISEGNKSCVKVKQNNCRYRSGHFHIKGSINMCHRG